MTLWDYNTKRLHGAIRNDEHVGWEASLTQTDTCTVLLHDAVYVIVLAL
jgi:hypothetical protein